MKYGFTDYYGEVEAITIMSYDNDRYATIIRENGCEEEIKRGYLYKNKVGYDDPSKQYFSARDWFVLGGGNIRYYKPRTKKTVYRIWHGANSQKIKTKRAAIKIAKNLAAKNDVDIEIVASVFTSNKSGTRALLGCFDIDVSPKGELCQFGYSRTTMSSRQRGRYSKWLRGGGKKAKWNKKKSAIQWQSGE